MAAPLISCIVPVFNGERYLAEALDSIFKQSWRPLEVIVVDDGSTDGTSQVASRYGERIRYIRQANAGPVAARNHGVRLAEGEFTAFLDADDIWREDKLACQMARFEARPELGVCTAHMQNFWAPELKDEEERLSDQAVAQPQPGVGSTLLARRALFTAVGPLDPDLPHRDTMDWITRATDFGAIWELLPDALVYRRVHSENMSRFRSTADRENLLLMVKKSLDRRRQA